MRFSKFAASGMLAVLLMTVGCSKGIEPDEDYCLRPGYKDPVNISLSVDDSFSPYKDVISEVEDTKSGNTGMRYVVSVYDLASFSALNPGSPVIYEVSDSPDFTVPLAPGKYRVFAWADYERVERSDNHYFHIDDFSDMLLVEKYGYQGSDPLKNGFSGTKDITVSYRTPDQTLHLSTTMAQYRLSASDTPDYNVGRIVISYPAGVPASINLFSDEICHLWQDVSFDAHEGECVAFDNILAEREERSLVIAVEVYDDKGVLRARRKAVAVPLIRGGITNVKARIYTVLEGDDSPSTSGGSGGINDQYDDTIFIMI